MVNARIIVSGIVQGVGFRWFVQDVAMNLGLYGTVRNLYNGDVEVLVEGEKVIIQEMIDKLKKGNRASRIDNCDVKWGNYIGRFSSFRIIL